MERKREAPRRIRRSVEPDRWANAARTTNAAPTSDVYFGKAAASDGRRWESRRRNYPARSQHSGGFRMRTWVKEKLSIGIALCRFYCGKNQVLMVQKRYTYAFAAFAHGTYDCMNDRTILALLNSMTIDEKIILQSLNYSAIWQHVWLSPPPTDSQKYRNMKNKFESAFIHSGNNMRLLDLIERSTNGSRVWEIPKGRQRKGEAEIHCAVREFYEETGIEKSRYHLSAEATRSHTFVDDGIQYVQKYYIATTHLPINPRISLGSRIQVEEIADIRWMSIEDIRFVDPTGRLEALVRPIMNYVKRRRMVF